MIKKGILLLVFFPLLPLVILGGCSDNQNSAEVKRCKLTISAVVNWDDDIAPDGVSFLIKPLDEDGNLVMAEGTVNAKLWKKPDVYKNEKGELIQEWHNLVITHRQYENEVGNRIYLEYDGYNPTPYEWGILELTILFKSGNTFTFEEPNMKLGLTSCRDSGSSPIPGCCP